MLELITNICNQYVLLLVFKRVFKDFKLDLDVILC